MKRFHVALAASDITISVQEYSQRLGQTPDLIIPDHYALWRTATPNLSIRISSNAQSQPLRHLGWELEETDRLSVEVDCNGIAWECFTAQHQAEEIVQAWPDISYNPTPCSS